MIFSDWLLSKVENRSPVMTASSLILERKSYHDLFGKNMKVGSCKTQMDQSCLLALSGTKNI